MSLINIDGALIAAYIALNNGLETAYEGEDFTPPSDGSDWAAVHIVPALTDFQSLGAGGTDLHEGFMQIDFNTIPGTGRAALIGYAQAIRDEFIGGKSYTRSGQAIRITNTERSPITVSGGFMRISVTVNWQAETARAAT